MHTHTRRTHTRLTHTQSKQILARTYAGQVRVEAGAGTGAGAQCGIYQWQWHNENEKEREREIKRLMLTKNIKEITQAAARRLNTLTPCEEKHD